MFWKKKGLFKDQERSIAGGPATGISNKNNEKAPENPNQKTPNASPFQDFVKNRATSSGMSSSGSF
jgi:hypothetical protein